MKDVILKLLLAAAALALFTIMIIGSLWDDSRTMDSKKDTQVNKVVIPAN